MAWLHATQATIALAASVGSKPWHYEKVDPHSGKRILTIDAKTLQAANDRPVMELHGMTVRLYSNDSSNYKQFFSDKALLNYQLETLTYGQGLSKVINLKKVPSK
jgi:hypothetical protein